MPEIVSRCVVCQTEAIAIDPRATFNLNLPEPYKVVRCLRCGLRWLSPRPSQAEYQELYETSYLSGPDDSHCQSVLARLFPMPSESYESGTLPRRRQWYHVRLQRIHKLRPAAVTILDIGAASGDFLNLAREAGWQISGVEPNKRLIREARRRYNIQIEEGDIDSCDFHGKTFDVIHLSHVFEHLLFPEAALGKITGMMHSQSLLVIEVPNQLHSCSTELVKFLKWHWQVPRDLYSIHHPFFYERRHLIALLQRYGLEPIWATTYFPERWTKNWRHRGLRIIEFVADRLGGWGDSIEVIAGTRAMANIDIPEQEPRLP